MGEEGEPGLNVENELLGPEGVIEQFEVGEEGEPGLNVENELLGPEEEIKINLSEQ